MAMETTQAAQPTGSLLTATSEAADARQIDVIDLSMSSQERGGDWLYPKTKRLIDLLIAVGGLVVCFPLGVIIAILIKMDSPGPVFYRPWRAGKGGRKFRMWKFRSMRVDAEALYPQIAHLNEEPTGLIIKIPNDPRVTRLGRILRKTSLDELPQFLNIVKGEMSLVGPRPPSPDEVAQYNERQRRRLEVLPGLTGLWQVSGRKDTSFEHMVDKDIEYIDNRSLWLDVKILLKTIPAVLWGRGAR